MSEFHLPALSESANSGDLSAAENGENRSVNEIARRSGEKLSYAVVAYRVECADPVGSVGRISSPTRALQTGRAAHGQTHC